MLRKWLLASGVLAVLIGAAFFSRKDEPAGLQMVDAAEDLVASLTPKQKSKAVFAFDDKERTNWHFVPLQEMGKPTRKGLRLEEMTPRQQELTRALLKAGTSASGYQEATNIMSMEFVLAELEEKGKDLPIRNPSWYFLSIFGEPGKNTKWGWRLEGHHMSLNFTLNRGRIISATPFCFGANPAVINNGQQKLRNLPEAEESAQKLFAALDAEQKKTATQPEQFPEIEEGKATPNVGKPVGLPASKMNAKQRKMLEKLIEGYAERMPPEVAKAEMAAVREAGLDKVYFAFHRDDDKPGKPYTYRVQGPTFVIEFLNTREDGAKNPANHIHSVWRNIKGDFGLAAR